MIYRILLLALVHSMINVGTAYSQSSPLPRHVVSRMGTTKFAESGHILRYSPDGKYLALASENRVRVFVAATAEVVTTLEHTFFSPNSKAPFPSSVTSLTFSKDGSTFATGDRHGTIRIWSGQSRTLGATHPGLTGLCFSADQKSLFSTAMDGEVRQWSLATGLVEHKWELPDKAGGLAVSILGTDRLLGVSAEGMLVEWNLSSGKEARKLDLGSMGALHRDLKVPVVKSKGMVFSNPYDLTQRNVTFSPDGKWLVQHTGSQVWNTEKGQVVHQLPQGDVVGIDAESRFVVMAGYKQFKQPVKVFELATGKEVASVALNAVRSAALAPGGKSAALCSQLFNRVLFWDTSRSTLTEEAEQLTNISHLDLSRDGKMLVAVERQTKFHILDPRTGLFGESFEHPEPVSFLRIHPDNQTLITAVDGKAIYHWKKEGGVWKILQKISFSERILGDDNERLVYHPYLVFGQRRNDIINVLNLKERGEARPSTALVVSSANLFFNPPGTYFIAKINHQATNNPATAFLTKQNTFLYRMPGPKLLRALPSVPNNPSWVLSSDGRVAMLKDSLRTQVLEVSTWNDRLTFEGKELVTSRVFSPDDRSILVALSKGDLVILDAYTGKEVDRIANVSNEGFELRTTANGQVLALVRRMQVVVFSPDVWKRKASQVNLKKNELELYYGLLAEAKGPKVAAAMAGLIESGDIAVKFLREKIAPMTSMTTDQGEAAIKALSGLPPARKEAAAKLNEVGADMFDQLHAAIRIAPNDVRPALEKAIEKAQFAPARLQPGRAVEILERINSPAARTALEQLAQGHEKAWLTREAQHALERLKQLP